MERHRDVNGDVEQGLDGADKLKILRLLLQSPNHAFTRYEIGKMGPNDATSIRNDLQTLVTLNWVTAMQVHHLHKYVINREREVVQQLATFLKATQYL